MWESEKTESYTACSGKKSLPWTVAGHPRETGRDVAIGKCLHSSAFRSKAKILLMTLEAVNLYSRVLGISVSKGVNVQNQPATSYQLLARDIG